MAMGYFNELNIDLNDEIYSEVYDPVLYDCKLKPIPCDYSLDTYANKLCGEILNALEA